LPVNASVPPALIIISYLVCELHNLYMVWEVICFVD
jgi:hypothetical protein